MWVAHKAAAAQCRTHRESVMTDVTLRKTRKHRHLRWKVPRVPSVN